MAAGRVVVAALWFAAAAARVAEAQSAAQQYQAGMRAYDNLQYAQAVALFRRALEDGSGLAQPQQYDARAYIAAAQLLQGRPDSASAAAAELLADRPRYRPDELIFPPEVSGLFADVARRVRSLRVELPPITAIRPGAGRWLVEIETSAPQDIEAALGSEASAVRTLYRGPISDTLALAWNGLDGGGRPVAGGRYWFSIVARAGDGVSRELRWPLDVQWEGRDTLPDPPEPADSLRLKERMGSGPALEAAVGGLLASAAIVFGPGLVAPQASPSPARFAIAGAVDLAALAGVLRRFPGRAIEANRQANAGWRDRWRARVDSTRAENRRRRETGRLVIKEGKP